MDISSNVINPANHEITIDEDLFESLTSHPEMRSLTDPAARLLEEHYGSLVTTIHVETMPPADDEIPRKIVSRNYRLLRDHFLKHATGATELILSGRCVEAHRALLQLMTIRTEQVKATDNNDLQHFDSLSLFLDDEEPLSPNDRRDLVKIIRDIATGTKTKIKQLRIGANEAHLASDLLCLVTRRNCFNFLESLHFSSHYLYGQIDNQENIPQTMIMQYGIELPNIDNIRRTMRLIRALPKAIKEIGVPASVHPNTLSVFTYFVNQNPPQIVRFALHGVGYVREHHPITGRRHTVDEERDNLQGIVEMLNFIAVSNTHIKQLYVDGCLIPRVIYEAMIHVVEYSTTQDQRPRSLVVHDRYDRRYLSGGLNTNQANRLCSAIQTNYHVYLQGLPYEQGVPNAVKLMVASHSRLNQYGRAWVMAAIEDRNEFLRRASEMLSSATQPDLLLPDEFSNDDAEPEVIQDSDQRAREKLTAVYVFIRYTVGF